MNAIQIVRESEQFPEMERLNEQQVNFFFDHSERPYGIYTQYMAMMTTVDYPQEEEKEDDIEEVKALALPSIKEYRISQIEEYDRSGAVNTFYINGNPMWLTVQERQQIATQISANEAIGRETMTKWFGGNEYTFPIALWKQMLVAVEVYAGDALNVTESHKVAVSAIEDADEALGYDITAGYPEKIHFGEEPEPEPEPTPEPQEEETPSEESEETTTEEETPAEEPATEEEGVEPKESEE